MTTRAASATIVVVRGVAMLLVLGSIARVVPWLFPPWWTPSACAVLLIGLEARRVARRPTLRWRPAGVREWVVISAFALTGALAASVLVRAKAARTPPRTDLIDLAFPLAAGRYLIVNGGGWGPINSHRASVTSSDPKFIPWRGNGWAVDIVAIDRVGMRARGIRPQDPAAYFIFGRPVQAPCVGDVIVAIDGRPDMPVPEHDRPLIAGNHVILACDGLHVALAHLRFGSVTVSVGQSVDVGQVIGAVGNSGGSDEPHLHVHAQRPGPAAMPMGGDPVPVTFGGRFLVRGDRVRRR